MPDNLFLKPVIGPEGKPMLVRDPVSFKPLDAAGEWKTANDFWLRRIRDKDVIDDTASQSATPARLPAQKADKTSGK